MWGHILIALLVLLAGLRMNPDIVNYPVTDCKRVKVQKPKHEQNKCALVTGASTKGIGLGIVEELRELGVRFITTGRSKAKALDILEGNHQGLIATADLDLNDNDSISAFAEFLTKTVQEECHDKLDYVFLNAGLLYTPDHTGSYVSKDKLHDFVYQANFVGNVKLLRLLEPLIGNKKSKIVVTSSILHYLGQPSAIYKSERSPSKEAIYSSFYQVFLPYGDSKLALNTYSQMLVEQNNYDIISCTCGLVTTENGFGYSPMSLNYRQGAKYVVDVAFLAKDQVAYDEFVLPYPVFGVSLLNRILKDYPRLRTLAIVLSETVQKLTAEEGFLWVCAETPFTKDKHFREFIMKNTLP